MKPKPKLKTNPFDQKFVILSISGGGYKGIYSVNALKSIDDFFESDKNIIDRVDMVCGTSVGAITSAFLSLDKPISDAAEYLESNIPPIFKKSLTQKMPIIGKCFGHKDRTIIFKDSIKMLFEDKKMEDCKIPVIIPVLNFDTGSPKLFKSYLSADKKRFLWDVLMAATSTPLLFDIHVCCEGTMWLDGAFYANSPTMIGIIEALRNKIQLENIYVLSVGTTHDKFTYKESAFKYLPLRQHFRINDKLSSVFINSQISHVNDMVSILLNETKPDRYYHIDYNCGACQSESFDDEKQVSNEGIRVLKQLAKDRAGLFTKTDLFNILNKRGEI